ncbi:MAG: HU family DNA-binding protein, partial [Deltaproteobacteria bacterium]
MTKTQIIASSAEKAAITKKQAGVVLTELCELAGKAIKKADKFAIPGFVTVKVRARKARIGRNPQTGAAIKIPAKKVVKALPAKALKDLIGSKKKYGFEIFHHPKTQRPERKSLPGLFHD